MHIFSEKRVVVSREAIMEMGKPKSFAYGAGVHE